MHASTTCPSLRSYVDFERLQRVEALFNARFPGLDMLRNGLAHSAQNAKSQHKAEFNAFKLGDGSRIESYGGSLAGDFLGLTVNGKIHGFVINRSALTALRRMQSLVYGAVREAVRHSEQVSAQMQQPQMSVCPPSHTHDIFRRLPFHQPCH